MKLQYTKNSLLVELAKSTKMWVMLRALASSLPTTRQRFVLVLNEMVLVLLIDGRSSITSTSIAYG